MIETVFKAEDLPVADRVDAWREKLSQTHTPVDLVFRLPHTAARRPTGERARVALGLVAPDRWADPAAHRPLRSRDGPPLADHRGHRGFPHGRPGRPVRPLRAPHQRLLPPVRDPHGPPGGSRGRGERRRAPSAPLPVLGRSRPAIYTGCSRTAGPPCPAGSATCVWSGPTMRCLMPGSTSAFRRAPYPRCDRRPCTAGSAGRRQSVSEAT